MLKIVLITLAVIVVVFVIVVALQPATFMVTRSITMAAPPAIVFEQVNDLRKWDAWSPWARLDPNAKNTFEGPPAGTGAVCAWSGNNQVGMGRMTITESRTNELVRFRLEFVKPMAGTSDAEFTFKTQGGQTAVTWTMTGKNNFIAKAMCLFMSMDKMAGGQFEKGLANLKNIAEAAAKK